MTRLRLLSIKAGVIIALALGFIVSPHAFAGGIGGRPALPQKDEPRSQSIFIHTLKAGQSVDDKVLVENSSDKPQTIDLYVVDAIPSNTGAFTCKQRVEPSTDAGAWIKLKDSSVTLKAGTSEIVDFTITAPQYADVGEHNACLVIQSATDNSQVSGNLRIQTRSAIRVALTIPGKLHREVNIQDFSVSQSNFEQQYSLTLKNTGNVSADTKAEVRLKTVFGETVYSNEGQYPVLAGNDLQLAFQNTQSPFFGGWYFASASISYDKNASTWGTQTPANLVSIKTPTQLVFVTPQPLAIIIIIFAILVLAWLVWSVFTKDLRRQRIRNSWSLHRVKEGDTVQSLADRTDINWKKIVKVNQLKAPYTLETGNTIYIPKTQHKTTPKGR